MGTINVVTLLYYIFINVSGVDTQGVSVILTTLPGIKNKVSIKNVNRGTIVL